MVIVMLDDNPGRLVRQHGRIVQDGLERPRLSRRIDRLFGGFGALASENSFPNTTNPSVTTTEVPATSEAAPEVACAAVHTDPRALSACRVFVAHHTDPRFTTR